LAERIFALGRSFSSDPASNYLLTGIAVLYRFSESNLREALNDTPLVLVHGSRQCAKTTLEKKLAASWAITM